MRRAALLAFSLAACGGGGAANHVLSGKIDGNDWTLVAAQTDPFFSRDETFWADLYDLPIEAPCSGTPPDAATRGLILTIPKAVGSYPVGQIKQVFMVGGPTGTRHEATDSALEVTALTATTIRGHATITFDADNTVSGTFEIPICR